MEWILENYGGLIGFGVCFIVIAFAIKGIFYTVYGRRKSTPGNKVVK